MSIFKTSLLLFILTSLFMLIGFALGGKTGMYIALIFAGGINFFAYWNSDKIVLKMSGASIASNTTYPEFYTIVQNLTSSANMSMPQLYIMQQDTPNAFATGRNPENSAVAITTGLWSLLSKEELSGVIAHELAHIKNRDTLISTIAATFAGAISMLANMFMFMNIFGGGNSGNRSHPIVGILIMLVAPIASTIIQMAISRQREYLADKIGGEICGNPLYLASALKQLENYNAKPHDEKKINPAVAHMFIVSPFSKQHKSSSDNIFSTHPNTKNRVLYLEAQAEKLGVHGYTFKQTHAYKLAKHKVIPKKDNQFIDKHIPNNPWL